VAASVDRFGRSLLHGIATIDRIEKAGGAFFAVGDGLDSTTDTGRMVLEIMLSIADHYRRQTRASWEVSVRKAVARGVFVGSQVPVGYRKTRAGRLRLDSEVAPTVSEVFERRAAGETLASLGRLLEAHGVRTAYGNPGWLPETVRRVLSNRVYLGEIRHGRAVREHAHQPITDETTWQAAQHPRRPVPPKGSREVLLAGLVRCASCGRKMHPYAKLNDEHYYYGCTRYFAAGNCPGPAYIAHLPLEVCVEDVVLDLLARRRRPPDTAVGVAEDRVMRAQRALARYRDSDRVLDALGERQFEEGLVARSERLRQATLDLLSARTRRGLHDLPSATVLEAQWPQLDITARRALIGRVIDCVFVQPGKRNFDARIWVCPTGTEPRGLPRPGDKHSTLRPFEPRRGWVSARYAAERPPRWTDARLERELRAFCADRKRWPTPHSFHAAGRSRLHRQVELHGGDRRWAERLGLPRFVPAQRVWTDDEIRASLTDYLRDKDAWPPSRQFAEDRLTSLRDGIARNGGVRRWATEFGLSRRNEHNNGPILYWTDDRIRSQLIEFCHGRDAFTRRDDFRRAGLSGLVTAMQRRASLEAWATELGLPRERRVRRSNEPETGK
jgi:hypothetical protein